MRIANTNKHTLYLNFDVDKATCGSEINEIRKNFGGESGQITSSLFLDSLFYICFFEF